MKIIAKFDDDRKEIVRQSNSATERQSDRQLNVITALLCLAVWTYLCLHIGAYIERQGAAEQEDHFLRHYAQKMQELKEKESALIYAVRELHKTAKRRI